MLSAAIYNRAVCLLIFALILHPVHAYSQSESDEQANPEQQQIRVLPPAYDNQMMRLSEILGSLHYLRELCGADEGQLWREQMLSLIEKEEPTKERRAMMIARFNQGFRGFQETYRGCTPAALEANKRYIAEGEKLANEIPSRYGR